MLRVGGMRGWAWAWGLAWGLGAASAVAAPPDRVVIRDIGFRMANVVLPSGMRLVLEEDHSQPLVAVVAVVDVGSAQDPAGKEGLAHLVEHLMFRGKPDGGAQRSNLLGLAGAASWNAYTTHDLTAYYAVGPTEALGQLVRIEGYQLLSPLSGIDPNTFEVERGVVKNELRERDEQGQSTAIFTQLYGMLYPEGHPYHRPVTGTDASLSGLTLADAEAFVQRYYLPSNITFYVSGDLDLATVQNVFGANFPREFAAAPPGGPVKPSQRMSQEAPAIPPAATKVQLQTIRAPSESPMLYIGWSVPSGLAGQRYLERFARAMFIRSSVRAATAGSDIEGLSAFLDEGRYANTLVCAVLLKQGKDPEKTLERVLDQIVRMWAPSENGSRSALNSEVDFHWLQNTAVVDEAIKAESVLERAEDKAVLIHWTGDPQAWGKGVKAIYGLSRSKMESFAYEWITRDRARAVFVEPSEATPGGAPAGTPSVFASSDSARAKVAPEALATYVHAPVREIRTVTLKNGLQVLLVRRASAPTVAVTLGVRGGYATSEPLGVAELATDFADPTENRNGPASKFGGRLWLATSPDSTYYTGRASSGNLENLLALLSDSVRTLHVDGSAKWAWDALVSGKQRSDALATSQFSRTFLEHAYPGSPLGRTALAADYQKLTASDLQTWVDRTFRPKGAVLAVVGDIDPGEAEKLVRDWFEGWDGAADARAEAQPMPSPAKGSAVQVLRVDEPAMRQTEIRLGCSVAAPNERDRIALVLLGNRLSGRLGGLARSNLGGSYGFHGGASLHRQVSGLDVSGAVDDQALSRVLALARKELEELGAVKVSDDDLALLKWHLGIAANLHYTTNSELAQGLVTLGLAGLSSDGILKYPEVLASVTPGDLTRVGAECRKTAVLLVGGAPDVLTQALQATAR